MHNQGDSSNAKLYGLGALRTSGVVIRRFHFQIVVDFMTELHPPPPPIRPSNSASLHTTDIPKWQLPTPRKHGSASRENSHDGPRKSAEAEVARLRASLVALEAWSLLVEAYGWRTMRCSTVREDLRGRQRETLSDYGWRWNGN